MPVHQRDDPFQDGPTAAGGGGVHQRDGPFLQEVARLLTWKCTRLDRDVPH